MKYRCKPCVDKRVVEAVQITEKTFTDPQPNPEHVPGIVYDPKNQLAKLKADGTTMVGRLRDWIVTEETGEIAIYRAKYFAINFEPETLNPTNDGN